jgi:hypothetical protein
LKGRRGGMALEAVYELGGFTLKACTRTGFCLRVWCRLEFLRVRGVVMWIWIGKESISGFEWRVPSARRRSACLDLNLRC